MKKISKFLSIVLAACMIFGMLPALSVSAADAEAGGFMEITSNNYLSTVGSNAFNVFMYDNTFSGTFGDQHMGGIEMSLNGVRIATNGDLHLLPTPEQWDATPAPSRGSITRDRETNTITVPMTFSGATDGTLRYDLIASSTAKGMKLQMILRTDMPESLKGKARFNLELRPASYKNKSYQADLNGDGVYDSFGVFPLHPQDAMIETERPNLPSQAWYVKDWNEQRGDDQPAPFATAYGFSLSPEDDQTAITFTSNTEDKMELLDGRNRAQNGWYVLSTVISATKSGETAIEWIVEPKVDPNWVREPNVGFSQVGYTPAQEKFAVVELDKWDNNYPKEMSLWRVNADGTEEKVCEKTLGSTTDWMRFKYARFDFSEVTQAGLYQIHYGDYVGEIFPIAKTVYEDVWHSTLSGFLAVQMDHIVVREGYKIWHGASHMDDGVIGDRNSSWFDGMQMQTMPQAIRNKGYKGEDHIDGLNKGGWFDAGDFDLQISRNVSVLGDLVNVGEICGRADNYDDLSVTWDDETGGLVEMHRPDGIPDVVEQCIHGVKQLLAEYECLGGTGGCMEVRYLRQYTHLGDPSSDTDGWIYDSSLKEGEVVERDGKVYSGVADDRYFLTAGGGGNFSAGLSQGLVNSFAGTAYMAVDYPATQEYAQHVFNVCIDRWKANNWTSNWDTVVQFALASDAFEKNGVAYDDQDTLSAAYFRGLLDNLIPNNLNAGSHINVLALKHMLTDDQWAQVGQSVQNQNVSVNNQPYGVNFTSGASWGASPNTYSGVRNISYMYYHFPLKKFEQNILRSVNYLMGRHPATNSSWISGVGTKSMLHPYNSNRAEESYIPGSILPGHITFSDYVESMDDFNFLWFENESIISYQAQWLPVGIAAGHIAANEPDPEPAETKDFESSFDAELVTKTSTSMWGGGSSNYYFSDDGFNMIMYATDFDRTFGDQHCAGIELIQGGRRIATNGDIHLLPTPEQWDATPAPTKGTITAEGNTVTVPMTIPAETFDDGTENPAVNYQLIATPEKGGIKLTVKLDAPLPADLVGKAGFNMEFLPAVFIGKSYQSDTDGDGVYDQFGVFPQDPRDEMVDMERARTNNQAWYVQEWNEQRGDYQPVAFSTGKKITLAAETDEYRLRVSCDDGLSLYDGRNRAQNGWFVMRTLIPAGKTEIVWHISPDTDNGWVREPNITHSQVGYEPELSKVAVIELDPNYVGPAEAKLLKLEADGSYTEVLSKALGEAKSWQRYIYKDFDFSEVKARGTYVIEYDGVRSDPFAIDKHVYADIWTESIGNYMAVQMDHMRIREGYKIWRNAAHMDDALQAPVGVSYFDGQAMGASSDSPYEAYEHIPGLDVGGFSDAGDFDIQVAQNLGVINSLALAYQVYGERYDTLDVNWDTHNVELHRSDDVPDLVQLAKHGALNILAQIEAVGFTASVIEVPTLRQYTHLGDGSKDTDNRIYDPSLAEDETVGRRSGKRDDRLAFFQTKSSSSQLSAAQAMAASASILPDSDPDKARLLAAAEKLWADEPDSHEGVETTISFGQWSFTSGPADFNAAIELFNATGKEVYKNRILEVLDYELQTEGGGGGFFGGGANFASAGWRLVKIIDKLGDEAKAKFEAALDAYAPNIGAANASNPYGVSDTTGMWGGSGGVVSGAIMASVLHKYYPEKVSADCVFRAINYILGTHPYNSTSWISGVGANSLKKGYGSNRADFYYIAGGLAPGYVTIAPDFPEALDDFNFLWFENEYTVEVTANWILLTLGADDFARESDVPCEHEWQSKVTEPTCTKGGYTTRFCSKCFESETVDYTDPLGHDYDNGVITKQPTAMFDGVKTYTCQRCGDKYTEAIPAVGGNLDMSDIDFTDPADEGRFTINGQDESELVEGEGVSLVFRQGGVEPAKQGIEETEKDVVLVPVAGDWTATLQFDFDTNGARNGYYQFFGFYAATDYQNMVGIRGGDGAMQDFIRKNGAITEETKSSSPGLANNNTYWYRIDKQGDTYTCYRSEDGEEFTEMFSYEETGIEASMIVIDGYTGMTEGYKVTLKSLDFENVTYQPSSATVIDFAKEEDNVKYEIIGETAGGAPQSEEGRTITCTVNGIEPSIGQNGTANPNLSEAQSTTPENLIEVPIAEGDWTASLKFHFEPNGGSGAWAFLGFYAAEGDDYQNMVGIRGGDGAFQDFIRTNGTITADTSLASSPGFSSANDYYFQIQKTGTTYVCSRSNDAGETFEEMFSFEDTGINAEKLIIDAYSGRGTGFSFTLNHLIIEGVGGDTPQPQVKPEVSGITVDGKAIEGFDAKVKAYSVAVADGAAKAPVVAATAGNSSTKIKVTQAAAVPGEAVIEASTSSGTLTYTVSFDYGPKDDYFADGAMNAGQWTILNEVKDPTEEEPYKYYRFDKGVGLVMPTQHNSIYQKATPGAWSNMFTMSGGGDWEVVAKAFYPILPDGNYQQVQFIAWQDEDNYVRINCQDSRRRTEPFYEKAGTAVNQNNNAVNNAIPLAEDGTMTMYFKINKAGNTYTLSYSEDGLEWKSGGVYEAALTNVKVAVFCTQDYQPTQSNYKTPVELAFEYVAVTSRDGKAVRSDAETLTWAAQNAANYIAADLPSATAEDLVFSPAPHGYTVEISSSDPAVIAADGKVTATETAKDVVVTVKVSEGDVTASASKTIRVSTGGGEPLFKSALQEAILAAEAIDRDLYTAESLAALDSALAAGKKAFDEATTQDEITNAALALNAAIAALEKKPVSSDELKLGPNVVKDPASPTGYTVKFLYDNDSVASVTFNGDISLKNDADRSDGTTYTPFQYKPGLMRAASFNAPMEKRTFVIDGEENEVWYYEVPMSAGANQYWYTLPGSSRMQPDPHNPPKWSPNSSANKDAYNIVYVPYDPVQDYEPTKAREAECPRTDGKSGVWDYYPIEFGGRTHYMGIYTPYGYVPKGAKAAGGPYKLIFMLHGMGQDESDWMGIGSVQKIMDNLVAAGKTEPAVIVSVTSNNSFLGSNGSNVDQYVLPYLYENYNVSTDPMDQAWAGLSMGSSNTQSMINNKADRFGWYGCFSLGNSVTSTNALLSKTHILFGDGTSDFGALNANQIAAVDTINANGGHAAFERVTGGHDFNTWCQLFRIWCEKYLWNPAAFGEEVEEVDTAALEAAIAAADAINTADYTDATVAAMNAALADAKAALSSDDQAAVDAAAAALNAAIAALEPKPVEPPPAGSKFKVTVPHAAKVDKTKAAAGETVTITGDDTIANITVADADGKAVAVSKNGNVYTFKMPASAVSAKVIYATTAISALQSKRIQGNPFIPIYDFNPDTEPHIWEDPDNPGQYRFYFLSSHDMNKTSYCSNNHVLYSCPVDDPFNWTYHGVIVGPDNTEHNDTLYAPDMCCVEDPTSPTGKYYYYYPCNQAGGRQTMVLRSSRPDGKGDPFTVINWADESHNRTAGSIMTFDPSVFVDDDGKVYGYWGGYNSSCHGAQLDETMYNAVPGTQVDDMFEGDGVRGSRFGFFEASSMRKIGDTYVFVYSSGGKSGDPYSGDYHHLAYVYGKNPLGPWTYGGVIVDAQAYGFYGGGNTHGSLIQLGDQWYITYHRNVETNARQAMVSPVDVTIDENGAVKITEAEVSSEGFYINGLDPYAKVSLGTASYARNCRMRPLYEHDVESMPIINVVQNTVFGVTYFDFNTEAPAGATSSLDVSLVPNGVNATVNVWVQSANVPDSQKRNFSTANATKIGEFKITADMPKEMTTLSVDTPYVDQLDGKYGVYYTFSDVSGSGNIGEFYDMQFAFSDHEHEFEESVVAPTCLEGGYTVGVCKICGKELKYDYTDALGHDWDEGKVTVPATETSTGVMTYTCKRCGETKTARIPRIGSTVPDDIDFTLVADKDKYEIVNQSQSDCVEGEGVALIATTQAFEDCKTQLSGDQATTPVDVVKIPVEGDWVATLKVDFSTNGANNGYYQFFGFYASQGDDYQNMAGIRGGDGAMQNFERHDGTITHQDEDGVNSTPGFASNGIYYLRIEKVGEDYTCFRSDDGETFTEMFAYPESGIDADYIIIDAYTGMTQNYKFTLKSLTFEDVGAPAKPKTTALKAAIAAAEAVNKDLYTDDSVAAMEAALAAAKEALNADTQAAVDAATEALNAAVAALKAKPPVIDKAALQAAIAAADQIDKSKYTADSVAAFETALAAAKEALNAETQAAVDSAVAALNAAVNGLVVKPEPVNYDALNAAIAEAEKVDTSKYTDASVAAFNKALADAKAAKTADTQAAVDNAKAALETAKAALVLKPEPIDYSALEAAIADAEKVDTSKYTDASVEAFNKALADAKAAKTADNQAAVNAAKDALVAAKNGLVEKPAPFRFDDVKDKNQYYFNPVYWAYEHEPQITNGTSKNLFSPEKGCTRAQVVTFLWRYAGMPEPETTTCSFKDVDKEQYYYKAVLWAVEKKITNGTSETTFDPEKTCTRAQIVTFLWRYAGEPKPATTKNDFKDVKDSAYYYNAVLWAAENDITNGTSATTFDPEKTCTRAQIVTFLYRYDEKKGE